METMTDEKNIPLTEDEVKEESPAAEEEKSAEPASEAETKKEKIKI